MVLKGKFLSKGTNTVNGRKYKLALVSFLVLVGSFAIVSLDPKPILIDLFSDLVTGIFLIDTAYMGGNVANKWATKRPLTQRSQNTTVDEGDEHNGNVGN